jgi:hypothetical protein
LVGPHYAQVTYRSANVLANAKASIACAIGDENAELIFSNSCDWADVVQLAGQ